MLYNLNLVSVTSRQQNFLLHNYEAKRRNYARKRGYSFKLFHIHKHKNKTFQPQAVNFKAESELCGKLIGTSSIIHALQSCCYLVEIWVKWYKTNPQFKTQDKIGIKTESHLWYGSFKCWNNFDILMLLNHQHTEHKKRKALFDG